MTTEGGTEEAAGEAAEAPRRFPLLPVVLLALGIAGLLWSGIQEARTSRPAAKGLRVAPAFQLEKFGGGSIRSSELRGKVVMLDFWATWCPPCVQEAPKIQRLIRDFSGHRDFAVLMVAVADSSDRVNTFLGPGSPMVLFDPNWKVANRYGTDKLPETYLVIRGQVVRKWVGATDWDDPALRAEIAARLKGGDKTASLELP